MIYFNMEIFQSKIFEVRQLCLDAMLEEGDTDTDWRLTFQEFKILLSDSFRPSVKGGDNVKIIQSQSPDKNIFKLDQSSGQVLT